jgi:YfiH family protein
MKRVKVDKIEKLQSELLLQFPKLKHGTLLRLGGNSEGPFANLNLAYDVGDNKESVDQNISTVKQVFSLTKLIWAKQCHGVHVEALDESSGEEIIDCDAFITNSANVACMIKHADCQAAVFYDPIHHAVANVHAGWRGSVQNIYKATLDAMKRAYGSKVEELHVYISPSLGPTVAEFRNYKEELPEPFWEFKDRSHYFNFWEISRMQLTKAGVLSHHIDIAELCTYSNADDFFSFRRDKLTGRHATLVHLQ